MADTRTYKDRAASNIAAVKKRRKKLKRMAVPLLGNKCYFCAYNNCIQALEFHHLDDTRKSFGISQNGFTRSWDKLKREVKKCILVCANCHREIHAGIRQPPQETVVSDIQ